MASNLNLGIHPFERAGLGQAPFTYECSEHRTFQAAPGAPVQVGGSCDFCGQGITNMYWVRSADGRKFKVGPDCIRKVEKNYDGSALSEAVKKAEKARKLDRDSARVDRAASLLPTVGPALEAQPHPTAWAAAQGRTLYDYVLFLLQHGGNTGRVKAARLIERAVAVQS